MCVCVCRVYCSRTKFIRQTISVPADFSLRFQDFQLTKLSEVVSFTSSRPSRSFFEVAAILLHDKLLRAPYAHWRASWILCTISHVAFVATLELKDGCWSACIYFILTEVEVVS